ncbi:hypothetical protein FGIG_11716 [Fasciola gigantica]|uniref:Uncharacterized protein n=1 Tax=Fasciola gigantica TaxID=46835 RepID=A0A504YV40_FASGI|nr:hypothetical protein FGIG_11716 [Fasciola gigantica]
MRELSQRELKRTKARPFHQPRGASQSLGDLKEVRSPDRLEPATKEGGSESDFDLALQLRYGAMQQMQEIIRIFASAGAAASSSGIATQDAASNRSSAANSSRHNSTAIVTSSQSRWFCASSGQECDPLATATTDHASGEGKCSCSPM